MLMTKFDMDTALRIRKEEGIEEGIEKGIKELKAQGIPQSKIDNILKNISESN